MSRLFGAVDQAFKSIRGEQGATSRLGRSGSSIDGLEPLESRRLFTTLVGGDVFEYTAPDPANPGARITNRIVLTGNIVAELIGGNPTDSVNNGVIISDVPGRFFESDLGRDTIDDGTRISVTQNGVTTLQPVLGNFLGGIGGGTGVRRVANSNPSTLQLIPGTGTDVRGSTNFNIKSVATASDGTVYAFNISRFGAPGSAGEQVFIELERLTTTTVNGVTTTTATSIADIHKIVDASTAGSNFVNANGVLDITAAAFDPVGGRLYFVVRGKNRGVDTSTGTVTPSFDTQQLFSIAVDGSSTDATIRTSAIAYAGSFGRSPTHDTAVTALAFDRNGSSSDLYAYLVDGLTGAPTGSIFKVNQNFTDQLNNRIATRIGTNAVNGVTGLAFVNDDPTKPETSIYAVESGSTSVAVTGVTTTLASTTAGAQVLQFRLSDGAVTQLGSLAGPSVNNGTNAVTGANLQDLTFSATTRNPFTGQRGVLIGIDDSSNEVVYVDSRNRFPNTGAFSLYIAQSDASASIVVGQVANFNPADPTAPRPMMPYAGGAGVLRVVPANGKGGTGNNGLLTLTGPTGVGGVYLGIKTSGNTDADFNNIPIIASSLGSALGVKGAGGLQSGIVTSQSLLKALTSSITLSDRLLGQNVTDVEGLVVTKTGVVYGLDSDGIAANGNLITNDQLITIDRTTGKATASISVKLATGASVQNNRGLTIDDNERILAVFLQQFAGSTGGGNGGTLPGGYPDFSTLGQTVVSLSISGSGPTGFILAQSNSQKFLYSFSNVNGSLQFQSLGPIVDADGNSIAAANDLGLSNAGRLYTVGFSRGNPVPSGTTGGSTVDLSGVDARNLFYAADGNIYLLSATGLGLQVTPVLRDQTTGALQSLGTPVTIAVGGSAVQSLNDMTADPSVSAASTGSLLGIGSSSTALLPTRSTGALTATDGSSDFLYRGLTRLTSTDIYAVTFNGSTLNLRKTVLAGTPFQTTPGTFNVVPATPRTNPDGIPGTDIRYDANNSGRGSTTAVLGITSTGKRPGDATGIYAVGYGADALIPNQPVLGDLGVTNVQQMSMFRFSPVYSFFDTEAVTGSTVLPTTGAFQYALNTDGASGSYLLERFLRAERDTATGGLLNRTSRSRTLQIVGQSFTGPGFHGIFNDGPIQGVDAFQAGFGTVVNTIVDTHAIAVDKYSSNNQGDTTIITSGFNIDSPVPAAPIKGNLGSFFGVDPRSGESNLRGLAFGDTVPAGQLQQLFATVFNGTGSDLYLVSRSAVDGGITGFTKVDTGLGIPSLRDPRDTNVDTNTISFIYSIWKDPNTVGRFFFVGSSKPTAGSDGTTVLGAPMTLYAMDVSADGLSVTVNNSDQPPVDLFTTNPLTGAAIPSAGIVYKAGAINAAGQMFLVRDNSGSSPNTNTNGVDIPSSSLLLVDRTTGSLTNFGFIGVASAGSAVSSPWGSNNSDIRAMQFHIDGDGHETLVLLDQSFSGQSGLAELDFQNVKGTPQVLPGGVPASISGMNTNPRPAAVPIYSSLQGMMDASLTTFTMDQYGRGFSIKPGTASNNPDTIWTSPNELYAQDSGAGGDIDGDNWIQENVRIGWMVNPDGTAFTDTFSTWASTLDGTRLVGIAENEQYSSNHPGDPLFGQQRLYSLIVPGTVKSPTINTQQRIVISPVVRAQPPVGAVDNAVITINGNATASTAGLPSHITGLAFDVEGGLIGLDQSPDGAFRLVGLEVDPATSDTAALTGNPTYNTFTLTDAAATSFISVAPGQAADPRGLSSDYLGRFYSSDGGTITAGTATRLLVSTNTVSIFRIDAITGVATKLTDLADGAQITQTPILSRFGGIAFGPTDPNKIFLIQKDIRSNTVAFDAQGTIVGVDRLVTLTYTGLATTPFTRYNSSLTAGAIQVGGAAGTTNTPTGITAIDFNSQGQLIALDNGLFRAAGGGFGRSNRLVRIELDTTGTNSQSPANSVEVAPPGSAAGLSGLTALGTQFASVQTGVSPDVLLLSNNDLSLFAFDPVTGTTTTRAQISTNGVNLSDDQPVIALATQPIGSNAATGSGLIYAILRGVDPTAGTPADFLYQIDATNGFATAIGQVQLTLDQNGNPVSTSTRITNIDFSGERDANGNYILYGINDPNPGTNSRQIVKISLTGDATSGTAIVTAQVIAGSDPGEFKDSYLGFASDVINADAANLPIPDRGRFYTLNTAAVASVGLNVTPTQLYDFAGVVTTNTASAKFNTVATILAAPTTNGPSGTILNTIRTIDFNPVTNQLYGIGESKSVSTLYAFPATLPADSTTTNPASIPSIQLSSLGVVTVGSASTVALPGQPVPTLANAPLPALVSSMFFLEDGTLRAVAKVGAETSNRLIDLPSVGNSLLWVARTNGGVPDSTFTAFDEFNSLVYAIDNSDPQHQVIATPTDSGTFVPSTNSSSGGTPVLGSPTIGVIAPSTGIFTPFNTGDANTPGKLPSAITDVKAMAFDRVFTSSRTSAGLFIVDQNNHLIRLTLDSAGTTLVSTTDLGPIIDSTTGLTLNIGSLSFDGTGRLLAQDLDNARIVVVDPQTAQTTSATTDGSLLPTVGAIAYDPIANRILVADNSTGINTTAGGSGASSQILQAPISLLPTGQDIGSVFIGGTVTGNVSIAGSIGKFYAGWIITGTDTGLGVSAANPAPKNFYVNGDLQELITLASIGTNDVNADIVETQYITGTDIFVQGKIGSVSTRGDIAGTIRSANNSTSTSTITPIIDETEFKTIPAGANPAVVIGDKFQQGVLLNANFNNDTTATAQHLFATTSGSVTVSGILEDTDIANDVLDFYSIALFGGQKIQISLSTAGAYFGIRDPDGRLIFSNHTGAFVLTTGVYQFTADRPGEYKIIIAQTFDTNFNGVLDNNYEAGRVGTRVDVPYTLSISGIGNTAIGAISTPGILLDHTQSSASGNIFEFSTVYAATGDIGSITAGAILGLESSAANTVRADFGYITSITAGQIGEIRNGVLTRGMSYSAAGGIGLIKTTTGVMVLNSAVDSLVSPLLLASSATRPHLVSDLVHVGASIQEINAADVLVGNIVTDGGIGSILAGSMASTTPSFIEVNADRTGTDGIIDNIDVTGDIGTNDQGGPVINTNNGGNVRYMRAGGAVFRDRAFGGGNINQIFLTAGTPLNFIDDSGATLSVGFDTSTLTPNPLFDPTDPNSAPFLNAPTIAYQPFPIRGSGGAVMMILQITGLGFAATNAVTGNSNTAQLQISSHGGSGSGAEISSLVIGGTDNAVTIDATTGTFSQTGGTVTATPRYGVRLSGDRIDVGQVSIRDASGTAAGNISFFQNGTGGELLDFVANSVGTLSTSGDLGVARTSVAGGAVQFQYRGAALGNTYPFVRQENIITPGNVIVLSAAGSMANVFVNNAQTISAGTRDTAGFDGITGPVLSNGVINTVNIGDGVLPSGFGEVGGGMVIALGRIGTIQGRGDVRGTLASANQIGTINIQGALINSLVTVYTPRFPASPFFDLAPINNDTVNNISLADFDNPGNPGTNNPRFEINNIRIGAGVLTGRFYVADVNSINVGGFGILNTVFQSAGGSRLNSLTVSGYGIRRSFLDFGTSVGSITAVASKSGQLSSRDVTAAVRQSDFYTIDPFFGTAVDDSTDIYAFLGTSAAVPIIPGVTDTGVIEDLIATGNGTLGTVSAAQIRGSVPGTVNTQLNFANSIGTIKTTGLINGLTVRTGKLGSFAPGGDVLALDLNVSGPINSFKLKGTLGSNSSITSTGPNATIKNFTIGGNFDGSITSSGKLGKISIGGNFTNGTITVNPPPGLKGNALDSLTVGGTFTPNSLNVNGSVGTISVAGTLGDLTGTNTQTLSINGNLGTLNVGTNKKSASGKQLATNLDVAGNIGTINVLGRITGTINATGSIKTVKVTSDGDANTALIAAPITTSEGDIGTISLVGGDLASNISAFNKITAVNLLRGSILANTLISTIAGPIGTVMVKTGNLFGSIRSGDPTTSGYQPITTVSVDGDLGDGINTQTITGSRLNTLKVGGSVFSTTTVTVTGTLNSLTINGDLKAGSIIQAQAINKLKILGARDGQIIIA